MKDSYCSYCGWMFEPELPYPKHCFTCNNVAYSNPTPVSVVMVPVRDGDRTGLLLVKRAIEPFIGQWALPGGFIERKETWQQGAVREVLEETGISVTIDCNDFDWGAESVPNGNLLIFTSTNVMDISLVADFQPNSEVSEIKVVYEPIELAFPSHTKYAKIFFDTLYL